MDSKLKFSQFVDYIIYNKARGIRAALYPMFNQHISIPINNKHRNIQMYIVSIIAYAGPS